MMKKVFSFLLAVAVIATSLSSVFAAVSINNDGEGDMLIDAATVPEKSYYATVIPSTSITATQLTTSSEVQTATTTKFSKQTSLDDYDIYKLDIAVTNMGEIVNGYDEDWDAAYAGVYGVTVGFPTAAFEKSYILDTQLAGGTATAGQDGAVFNVAWAAGNVQNPYPIFDDKATVSVSQYQENGSMNLSAVVAVTKGSTLSLSTISTKVVYVGAAFTGGSYNNQNAAAASLALPPAPSTVLATSMATFTPATLNLQVGGSTGTITAALDSAATDQTIDWSTSDPSVATVANGVVTPVGAGTATITATAHDGSGVNATCTVTVKAANPAPILSQNFAKIDAGTALKDLKDASVDASVNYGAGRINTTVETDKYDYKVVAQDAVSGETHEWDAPMTGAEISGSINFIAIVKSADHTIGNIWLQAVVK